MIVERGDGRKYVDVETMGELLDLWWDDHDVICNGLPVDTFADSDSAGDGFVAVMSGGRLLSEDDVSDMANEQLREDYPDPVEIAWLERDVVEAFSRVAPDAYEEYVSEEIDRLIENGALRRLRR